MWDVVAPVATTTAGCTRGITSRQVGRGHGSFRPRIACYTVRGTCVCTAQLQSILLADRQCILHDSGLYRASELTHSQASTYLSKVSCTMYGRITGTCA